MSRLSHSFHEELCNTIFTILGFHKNPVVKESNRGRKQPPPQPQQEVVVADAEEQQQLVHHHENHQEQVKEQQQVFRKNTLDADVRLAMLSNFSTAYNVISIGLALAILDQLCILQQQQQEQHSTNHTDHLPQSHGSGVRASDRSLCSSVWIAGMIVGQIFGGVLGDIYGRHLAMAMVLSLQVLASFASAFSTNIYYVENSFLFLSTSTSSYHSLSNPLASLYHNDTMITTTTTIPLSTPEAPPTRYLLLSMFQCLAMWRFILGFGCGGVYPLAATLSNESNSTTTSATTSKKNPYHHDTVKQQTTTTTMDHQSSKLIGLTFSLQGIGYVAVPIVGWCTITLVGVSDLAWRIILGAGCIPGAVLILIRYHAKNQRILYEKQLSQQSKQNSHFNNNTTKREMKQVPIQTKKVDVVVNVVSEEVIEKETSSPNRLYTAILTETHLVQKLIGTAGTWFLFDIVFYGQTLFQQVVLLAAFGPMETIQKTIQDTFYLSCMALPGYFVTIAALGVQSPRTIQIQGFVIMGLLYVLISTTFESLSQQYPILFVFLYGLTFFFANYGPNATTFMLPALTYTQDCCSTLNGISAACGKMGALVGATMCVAITTNNSGSHQHSASIVFGVCAILSFVGAVVTILCVPSSTLPPPPKQPPQPNKHRTTTTTTTTTHHIVPELDPTTSVHDNHQYYHHEQTRITTSATINSGDSQYLYDYLSTTDAVVMLQQEQPKSKMRKNALSQPSILDYFGSHHD